MKLCLSLEIQEDMSYADALAMVRAGEQYQFETALLAEHYTPSGPLERYGRPLREVASPDAWIYLAALARETSTIRLGTLVSPVTFRHPSVVAKMVATLDHVSNGRAELGIGAGWLEGEHSAYGFTFPEGPRRVDLVEEQLAIITGLWTQDPFSYEGRAYQLHDCHFTPVPVQRPHPPVLVGGQSASRRLPRLAARYATDYVLTFVSADTCAEVRGQLDELTGRYGRQPADLRLNLFTAVCVGESEADVQRQLANYERTNPQYTRMLANLPRWVSGTVDQVTEQLDRLARAGVDRIFFAVNADVHREMLPLLAEAGRGLLAR